jgi:hypothetical protein
MSRFNPSASSWIVTLPLRRRRSVMRWIFDVVFRGRS